MISKRKCFILCAMVLLATMIIGGYCIGIKRASAAAKDIKIGVLYPLSGAPARNGNLMVQGIKAALGWINDNGGIKSLG
ncbi:MAG: ABC transporter substrate-binding protein, partial [Pseudomonadota bacterium]